jgi:hypothetical protein
MGAVFEERSFAVVGDDLQGFLLARSAYYLLLSSDDPEETAGALDALGVPGHLRSLDEDGSDVESDALLAWVSPGLPAEESSRTCSWPHISRSNPITSPERIESTGSRALFHSWWISDRSSACSDIGASCGGTDGPSRRS